MCTDHDAAVQNALAKEPPSRAAQPSHLILAQRDNPILNGRPFDARGPPVTLFEEVFSTFQRAMSGERQELEISSEYHQHVITFLLNSSKMYPTELGREQALKLTLRELLGLDIYQEALPDRTQSDGVCTIDAKPGCRALLLLLELKNEIGKGDCDPSVQASFSFSRWWSRDMVSFVLPSSISGTEAGIRHLNFGINLSARVSFSQSLGLGCRSMERCCLVEIGSYSHSRISSGSGAPQISISMVT